MSTVASAQQIAEYLIWLAANERPDEPWYLTPLQLQKPLYYAQGWMLAEQGRPLFGDALEAWRHGPVVPTVWQSFNRHGARPITEVPGAEPALAEADRLAVRDAWDVYKGYTAWELSDLTHEERPWLEARAGAPSAAAGGREIRREAIEREFREKMEEAERRLCEQWSG
jgi:uncharacterized phage-associated protein